MASVWGPDRSSLSEFDSSRGASHRGASCRGYRAGEVVAITVLGRRCGPNSTSIRVRRCAPGAGCLARGRRSETNGSSRPKADIRPYYFAARKRPDRRFVKRACWRRPIEGDIRRPILQLTGPALLSDSHLELSHPAARQNDRPCVQSRSCLEYFFGPQAFSEYTRCCNSRKQKHLTPETSRRRWTRSFRNGTAQTHRDAP